MASCGSAVASSGGQSSWRNEEERSKVTAADGESRGRENGESRGQARARLLQVTRDGEVANGSEHAKAMR